MATRSWTPSVRLRKGEDEVEVPIDRLVGRKEELTPTQVVERVWANREEGGRGWYETPLRSGELYGRELVVEYPFDYDPELGFVELPKVFLRIRHPDPQRVQLVYPGGISVGTPGKVLDSDQLPGKTRAVISSGTWRTRPGQSQWKRFPKTRKRKPKKTRKRSPDALRRGPGALGR